MLIDAGVDITKVVDELGRNGIKMDAVKGIVLTDEETAVVGSVMHHVEGEK